MPAALKNALDWASTAPEGLLHGKPVAIAGAPRNGTLAAALSTELLRDPLAALARKIEAAALHCTG